MYNITIFASFLAIVGCILGMEFVVAANVLAPAGLRDARRIGMMYGADLAGGCAAAVLVGTYIFPVWGMGITVLIAGAGKLISTVMVARIASEMSDSKNII